MGRRAKVFNFFEFLECAFDTIVRYDDGDGGVVCKTMNGLQAHRCMWTRPMEIGESDCI